MVWAQEDLFFFMMGCVVLSASRLEEIEKEIIMGTW